MLSLRLCSTLNINKEKSDPPAPLAVVPETAAPLRTLSQMVVSEFLPRFQGNAENKSKVTRGLMKIIIKQLIHLDKVLAGKPPHPPRNTYTLLTGSTSTIKKRGNLMLLESIF